jgi:hypothetical protein
MSTMEDLPYIYIEDIKLSDMKILSALYHKLPFFEVCSINKASQTYWPSQ